MLLMCSSLLVFKEALMRWQDSVPVCIYLWKSVAGQKKEEVKPWQKEIEIDRIDR